MAKERAREREEWELVRADERERERRERERERERDRAERETERLQWDTELQEAIKKAVRDKQTEHTLKMSGDLHLRHSEWKPSTQTLT